MKTLETCLIEKNVPLWIREQVACAVAEYMQQKQCIAVRRVISLLNVATPEQKKTIEEHLKICKECAYFYKKYGVRIQKKHSKLKQLIPLIYPQKSDS